MRARASRSAGVGCRIWGVLLLAVKVGMGREEEEVDGEGVVRERVVGGGERESMSISSGSLSLSESSSTRALRDMVGGGWLTLKERSLSAGSSLLGVVGRAATQWQKFRKDLEFYQGCFLGSSTFTDWDSIEGVRGVGSWVWQVTFRSVHIS